MSGNTLNENVSVSTHRDQHQENLVSQNITTFENKPALPSAPQNQIDEVSANNDIIDPSFSSSDEVTTPKSEWNRIPKESSQLDGWTNKVWKEGALRILVNVVRFIIYMLTNSEKFKFGFITRKIYTAINDQSSSYDFYIDKGLIREHSKIRMKDRFTQVIHMYLLNKSMRLIPLLNKRIYIIDTSSRLKIFWDVFFLINLTVQMFFVPIKICFYLQIENQTSHILLNQLPAIVFILEMIMSFMTGYYEHGQVILQFSSVAQNYLKSNFIVDFIALSPFVITYLFQVHSLPVLLQFVLLIRVERLTSLSNSIEDQLNLREHYNTHLDVLELLLQFLFLSHVFGCLWYYIAMLEQDAGYLNLNNRISVTWLTQLSPDDDTWFQGYITSIYWSSITQLTIGYGDIHPVTMVEKIYVIIVALISSVVFGYTISNVGSIFSQINESKKSQRYKMSLISSFVSKRNVNNHLQNKVKKFFEYYLKLDQSRESDCNQVLTNLSDDLKFQLKVDIYRKYLLKSKFISLTFSNEFIEEMSQYIVEQDYPANEYIVLEGHQVNDMYFVIQGQIELQLSLNGDNSSSKIYKIINVLKRGAVLAERYFMSDEPSPYNAKTLIATKVAKLKKEDFLLLINKFPIEFQKFKEAQNKLIMHQQIKVSGCELCYQNHTLRNCPFPFYQPNLRKIIKSYYLPTQSRNYKERKNVRSHHGLMDKTWIQQKVLLIGVEEDFYHEDSLDDKKLRQLDINFIKFASCKQQREKQSVATSPTNTNKQFVKIEDQFQTNHQDEEDSQYQRGNQVRNSKLFIHQLSQPREIRQKDQQKSTSIEQIPESPKKKLKTLTMVSNSNYNLNTQQVLYYQYLQYQYNKDEQNYNFIEDNWCEFSNYYPKYNINNVLINLHDRLEQFKKGNLIKKRKTYNNKIVASCQQLEKNTQVSKLHRQSDFLKIADINSLQYLIQKGK